MTPEQLQAISKSGTFDTYVGTLTRNLLAVREGALLRASEDLFL